MGETPGRRKQYYAFVSYAHEDQEFAKWLHGRMEAYRFPKKYVGTTTRAGAVPRRLRPVFIDLTDLRAGSNLHDELRQKIGDSHSLVVVCSPDAAKSHYVAEEIREFLKQRGAGRVFPVIVRGSPEGPERCFPEVLPSPDPAAPNRQKEPRQQVLLRLLAGVADLEYDDLRQRDRRRRLRNLAVVLTACILLALGGWQLVRNRAMRQSVQLAASAKERVQRGDPGALADAIRAATAARTEDAESALHTALYQHRLRLSLPGTSALSHAEFSGDGRWIVTASHDGRTTVWSAADGAVARVLSHPKAVLWAGFSGSARWVVTMDSEGAAHAWDWRSKSPPAVLKTGRHVEEIRFSNDGRRLITRGGGEAALWTEGGWDSPQPLKHPGSVSAAAISGDGGAVATLGDGVLCLWRNGSCTPVPMEGDLLALAPDGAHAAVARDQELRVIDTATRQEITCKSGRGGTGPSSEPIDDSIEAGEGVSGLEFSPDSSRVLVIGAANSAGEHTLTSCDWTGRLIDPSEHPERGYVIEATMISARGDVQEDHLMSARYSRDGRSIITVSSGNRHAMLWSGPEAEAVPLGDRIGEVTDAAFSPDGSLVVVAGSDGPAQVVYCDLASARVWEEQFGSEIESIRFSADGRRIAATQKDQSVILVRDAQASGRKILQSAIGGKRRLQISPGGDRVTIASQVIDGHPLSTVSGAIDEGRVMTASEVLDVETGRQVAHFLSSDAAVSDDGRWVAKSDKEGRIELVAADTGAVRQTWAHPGADLLALASDGALLVTASSLLQEVRRDWAGEKWNLERWLFRARSSAPEVLGRDHADRVVFSADGSRFAVGTWHQVEVFESRTGKTLYSVTARGDDPQDAYCSPDVALSRDGGLAAVRFCADAVRIYDSGGRDVATHFVADARDIQLDSKGDRLLTLSERGVAVRGVRSGNELHTFAGKGISVVALSPDGELAAIGSGKTLQLLRWTFGDSLKKAKERMPQWRTTP